jgi:hypothetical protein
MGLSASGLGFGAVLRAAGRVPHMALEKLRPQRYADVAVQAGKPMTVRVMGAPARSSAFPVLGLVLREAWFSEPSVVATRETPATGPPSRARHAPEACP